jgi:hypothetical protein
VIHSFAGGGDYDEAVPLFSNHWKIEKRFGIPNARLEEGNKGEFFRGLEWVHLFIGHRCRALECGGNQRATPLLQLHCSAAKSAVARWLPAHSKIFTARRARQSPPSSKTTPRQDTPNLRDKIFRGWRTIRLFFPLFSDFLGSLSSEAGG